MEQWQSVQLRPTGHISECAAPMNNHTTMPEHSVVYFRSSCCWPPGLPYLRRREGGLRGFQTCYLLPHPSRQWAVERVTYADFLTYISISRASSSVELDQSFFPPVRAPRGVPEWLLFYLSSRSVPCSACWRGDPVHYYVTGSCVNTLTHVSFLI